MAFLLLFAAILLLGFYFAFKFSPHVEALMRRIWSDPTDQLKVKVAKRVKELCVDGDVPQETAALMISSETGVMEEQVRELMRTAAADPMIMRMAFGSRAGGLIQRAIKRFGTMGG